MLDLWNHSLKGGLRCIEGKCMHLSDFFNCRQVNDGKSFMWEGINFILVRMPHIMTGYHDIVSYGLLIHPRQNEENVVFISTDTQFHPQLITRIASTADHIFHDCETSKYKSMVHAHYKDLLTLPASIRKKMWLYHYQPNPDQNFKKDGFRGFVQKGQEFIF